jgi:hypothetical protein
MLVLFFLTIFFSHLFVGYYWLPLQLFYGNAQYKQLLRWGQQQF